MQVVDPARHLPGQPQHLARVRVRVKVRVGVRVRVRVGVRVRVRVSVKVRVRVRAAWRRWSGSPLVSRRK